MERRDAAPPLPAGAAGAGPPSWERRPGGGRQRLHRRHGRAAGALLPVGAAPHGGAQPRLRRRRRAGARTRRHAVRGPGEQRRRGRAGLPAPCARAVRRPARGRGDRTRAAGSALPARGRPGATRPGRRRRVAAVPNARGPPRSGRRGQLDRQRGDPHRVRPGPRLAGPSLPTTQPPRRRVRVLRRRRSAAPVRRSSRWATSTPGFSCTTRTPTCPGGSGWPAGRCGTSRPRSPGTSTRRQQRRPPRSSASTTTATGCWCWPGTLRPGSPYAPRSATPSRRFRWRAIEPVGWPATRTAGTGLPVLPPAPPAGAGRPLAAASGADGHAGAGGARPGAPGRPPDRGLPGGRVRAQLLRRTAPHPPVGAPHHLARPPLFEVGANERGVAPERRLVPVPISPASTGPRTRRRPRRSPRSAARRGCRQNSSSGCSARVPGELRARSSRDRRPAAGRELLVVRATRSSASASASTSSGGTATPSRSARSARRTRHPRWRRWAARPTGSPASGCGRRTSSRRAGSAC